MKSLSLLGVLPVILGAFTAAPAFAQNAAGSAAFNLNANGSVVGASIAASVGDHSAMSVGISTSGGSSAYAIGSSEALETPEWEAPTGSEYVTETTGAGAGIVQISITGGDVTVDMEANSTEGGQTASDQAALDQIVQHQETIITNQQSLRQEVDSNNRYIQQNGAMIQDNRRGIANNLRYMQQRLR